MSQTDLNEARQLVAGIIGAPVWGASPGHGTYLTLEAGAEVPPTKPGGKPHGEWHLWVMDAAWRLESAHQVLIGSEDDLEPLGEHLDALNGTTINRFELSWPGPDAVVGFDNGMVLRLFAVLSEDVEHWLLFMPHRRVLTATASDGFSVTAAG